MRMDDRLKGLLIRCKIKNFEDIRLDFALTLQPGKWRPTHSDVCDTHIEDAGDSSPEVEFVPRYDRIAGSRDNYNVFTSNLPGAQNVTIRPASSDKTPAATAGARTVSQSQRDSVGATLPRAGALTVAGLNQAGRNGTTPAPETGAFSGVQYRAPAPGPTLRWENPHSDPYSVLNVFSRNQRYVKAPGRPDRQSARDRDTHPQSNSTQLKDPKMTSQQVVFGQTLEGHPMITRTTYTRVEATLQDRSQASQPSASGRARATRTNSRM
ncbi:uncharacterized protein [Littorina saxatilis]|uniref:uncharacterized protein n=1 Tax=Littorina saxatilis TaxID=31220 RepID=UPI0038B5A781